ncbi:MAG TPA: exosortase H [Bacteroidales bacterium]|nr:exosortase H [Bacteroidales bacterium]HSA43875.1 exosortase H [Bacteroidales bacterium]
MKPERKLKQKAGRSGGSALRDYWFQFKPVAWFVGIFVLVLIVFYVFWLSKFADTRVQPAIASLNASISAFLLNLFGQGTTASGDIISSAVFSTSVRRGCDAVEAMALFTVAVLAFPARAKYKGYGVLAGILILFFLNIIRIMSLFLTGVYYPSAFEFMHVEVWQILFIFFAIALFFIWLKRTNRSRTDAK